MGKDIGIPVGVLDHGFVRLVDWMGSDSSIVRAARVSLGEGTKTPEQDDKLIHYLMEHRHTSPFEHVTFTLHVKAPLFVVRQWQRHRTWSFNEISARYTELPDDFYVPSTNQVRTQSKTNKQSSAEPFATHRAGVAQDVMSNLSTHTYKEYKRLLAMGVARELARIVLPVGIYTEMYCTVDLHNLFHFLGLRLDEHAQYEIRVYAQAILDLIRPLVPVAVSAWEKVQQ